MQQRARHSGSRGEGLGRPARDGCLPTFQTQRALSACPQAAHPSSAPCPRPASWHPPCRWRHPQPASRRRPFLRAESAAHALLQGPRRP
eukprot:364407-Chlamydomonas_euryale.AAC.9